MDRLAGQIPTGTIVGLIWAGVSEMSCGSIATANSRLHAAASNSAAADPSPGASSAYSRI